MINYWFYEEFYFKLIHQVVLIKIDKPKEMMLCDVYNYENSGTEVKQSLKIGF